MKKHCKHSKGCVIIIYLISWVYKICMYIIIIQFKSNHVLNIYLPPIELQLHILNNPHIKFINNHTTIAMFTMLFRQFYCLKKNFLSFLF